MSCRAPADAPVAPSDAPVAPSRPSGRRRRAGRFGLAAALVAAALLAGPIAVAQASPAAAPVPVPPTAPPVPGAPAVPAPPPPIAPELASVPVTSAPHDAAQQARDHAQAAVDQAKDQIQQAQRDLVDLTQRQQEISASVTDGSTAVQTLRGQLGLLQIQVRQMALGAYVVGESVTGSPTADLDLGSDRARGTNRTAMRAARSQLLDQARTVSARLAETEAAVRRDSSDLQDVRSALASAHDRLDRATAALPGLQVDLVARTQDLEGTLGLSQVVGLNFPLVVLDTYWKAAASQPACGIQWWALAGIGATESAHGTEGGSKVAANGDTSRPIVGIALDGSAGTASIPDTDHGLLDGDPFHDRAVGPMQFIPSTWMAWARDGNGDGRADPNNYYDATMAAAAYLCASGPMRTDADLIRGFLSYNQDPYYAALVLQRGKTYGLLLPHLGVAPTSPPASALPPAPPPGAVTNGVAGAPPTAPPPSPAPSPAATPPPPTAAAPTTGPPTTAPSTTTTTAPPPTTAPVTITAQTGVTTSTSTTKTAGG